ncbi:putative G2-specific protein kinase nimA [Blattamonas nauphoetae]|uniref:non-specific serine/threonine protein kinase n=1 Tax=Blattamonas nauphoetae TaxID=2049346 RepID=A0ABQ9X264_9EUKA|nr:putative G2-specific protein kinase nimA [Blattamonas nauphoetae]
MSTAENQLNEYEILNEIGQGSFGIVRRVRHRRTQKVYAWKEVHYAGMSEKEKTLLVNEVNILRELHHPNIVRYYDRIVDKHNAKLYIIMEYCDGGDLGRVIRRCREKSVYVDEDVVWKILAQLSSALKDCHSHTPSKILHRDIKPKNIFLNKQKIAKLGDFGLSRTLDNGSFAVTTLGTPYYTSPEQIQQQAYDERSDIWSLGCVIYELCRLRPPFTGENRQDLDHKICHAPVESIGSHYSQELFSVIKGMLEKNSSKRITIDQLCQHPQIILRLRELKVQNHLIQLQKKEAELVEREKKIHSKELELRQKEMLLTQREQDLRQTFRPEQSLSRSSSVKAYH